MTRTELHNLLDDTVVYDVYKMLKSIGGDCKCSVDKDMVPHLSIDTGDDQCRIRVSTRAITDNNGEQGWEFIPTVVNASISETIDIDTQGDIRRRFKRWQLLQRLLKSFLRSNSTLDIMRRIKNEEIY